MEDIALDWIKVDSKDVTSDLAVGYIIGYLSAQAQVILTEAKISEKVSQIPKDKVAAVGAITPKDKVKVLKIDSTKEEIAEIREMIKPKIPKIRTEVYRALSV